MLKFENLTGVNRVKNMEVFLKIETYDVFSENHPFLNEKYENSKLLKEISLSLPAV